MRKHSVRKWLHAILDLLPIFLIPVFMIYSHRHTLTDVTTVDVQYKYLSNEVNTVDDLVVGNIYSLDYFNYFNDGYIPNFNIEFLVCDRIVDNTEDYDISYSINQYNSDLNNAIYLNYNFVDDESTWNLKISNLNAYGTLVYYDIDIEFFDIVFRVTSNFNDFILFCERQELLPQYTDYNVIESVQVDDSTSSITDVFIDNFTHTVNTKFNFSSTFNFNELWHWLDTNLFGAQNSQVMYAIYNIVVYEFLMDVLFIIYCLFMFIIDFAESCLDRPFNVTKRGK